MQLLKVLKWPRRNCLFMKYKFVLPSLFQTLYCIEPNGSMWFKSKGFINWLKAEGTYFASDRGEIRELFIYEC